MHLLNSYSSNYANDKEFELFLMSSFPFIFIFSFIRIITKWIEQLKATRIEWWKTYFWINLKKRLSQCDLCGISSHTPYSVSHASRFTIFRFDSLPCAHKKVHSLPYVIPFDPQIGSYMRGHAHGVRPLGRPISRSGIADASMVDENIAKIDIAKTTVTQLIRFMIWFYRVNLK